MNSRPHRFSIGLNRDGQATSEAGAVLVEGALVLPLFLAMIVGVMEVGLLMQHRGETRQSVSSAARKASLSANDANADLRIVEELRRTLGPRLPEVRYAIVFKAATGAARASSACVTAAETGTTGVPGECNVYSNAVLSAPDPNKFGYTTAEPTRTADQNWPARERSASYTGGRDLIGVQVRASFRSATGLVPNSTDSFVSVIRLEARGV
jgi:Flp pilus assembly protein TadG